MSVSDSTETSESVDQEQEDFESTSDCGTPVINLLDRLCQAPMAAVNRKRKVAQNLRHDGKRNKALRCMSEPKTISVYQRVQEFSDECFVVSANKLFCTACREEVSIKKSVITLHIKSGKHSRGKVQPQNKSQREQDIVMALQKYDKEVHPVGETLPTEKRVYKIKVVSTFLKAGVQITKIDRFRPLLYRRSRFPSCRKETDVKLNSIHTWRREEPYPTRD
jgi:hypothetical protein